jgi:hypothetical protein
MSREQTPISPLSIATKSVYGLYDSLTDAQEIIDISKDIQRLVKIKVQEALSPIIEECKTVIDNPNQLETTKGFASMIWYELQNAHQTNNYE